MKILELNTWTTADVILYLIRLHAPRHTKSFWEEVYLPCIPAMNRASSGLSV